MSHVQKMAVAVEAGVAYGTLVRYLSGKKTLRSSRKFIEQALVKLGFVAHVKAP